MRMLNKSLPLAALLACSVVAPAALAQQAMTMDQLLRAVEQGRVIYGNIRLFLRYLFACNLSEIVLIAAAIAAGLPVPLLPLQILFLNLVTDVFPAVALGMGAFGLAMFFWAMKDGQFEDLDGAAHRILIDDEDEPKENGQTNHRQRKMIKEEIGKEDSESSDDEGDWQKDLQNRVNRMKLSDETKGYLTFMIS